MKRKPPCDCFAIDGRHDITRNNDAEVVRIRVEYYHFLGLEMKHAKDALHVSQEDYTEKFYEKFSLNE